MCNNFSKDSFAFKLMQKEINNIKHEFFLSMSVQQKEKKNEKKKNLVLHELNYFSKSRI